MVNTIYLLSFVETPRKFIIAFNLLLINLLLIYYIINIILYYIILYYIILYYIILYYIILYYIILYYIILYYIILSFLYVCMVNTIYLLSFVETPRKFIIAELSIRKLGSSSVLIILINNN